ncbi:MAG TPA: MFS transporter [Thermoplasmata archaeon]|nr:MFS transporter [Thermoplasmata archaeon]
MADAAPPRSYRALLTDRRFLPFFLAESAGSTGYAVYAVTVPWLADQIGGPRALGLALLVEFGVYSLSFLAGPFIDRVRNLRGILVLGYLGQAGLAALLGLVAAGGHLTVLSLLALVLPLSAVWDFTWTAQNAAPPRLVPASDLLRANGIIGAVSGGNQVAGYAAGAGLVLFVGPAGGMFLYAGLNLLAAGLSLGVLAPRLPGLLPGLRASFREGWTYFLGGPGRPLLQISAMGAVQSFVSAAPVLLLTVLAAARPDGVAIYAVTFTAFALGGVAGSLAVGEWAPRRRLGRVFAVAALAEAGLLVAAVLAAPLGLLAAPAWAGVGAVDVTFYTVLLAYYQGSSPPDLIGRTAANAYLFRGTARALGSLALAGLLVSVAPVPLAVGVAVALVAVGTVGPWALPAARRMGF